MNKKLSDLENELKKAKEDVKDVQREILKKRTILSKLKTKNETKNAEKNVEINAENFTEFDLSILGQESIELLCKQKEKNENLENKLKKLQNEYKDKEKMTQVKQIKPKEVKKNYITPKQRIEITNNIEETHKKIADLSVQIKAKNREIAILQRKYEQSSNKKISIDSPEAAGIVREIGIIQSKIRTKEASIEKIENEYFALENSYMPSKKTVAIEQSEVDELYQEVQEIKHNFETNEVKLQNCIKEEESITSKLEKKQKYYLFLKKLAKKNKKLDKDPMIPVNELRRKLNELNKAKTDNIEVTRKALERQKKENLKLEKYIQKKKELLQLRINKLSREGGVKKSEIKAFIVNNANKETDNTKIEKVPMKLVK